MRSAAKTASDITKEEEVVFWHHESSYAAAINSRHENHKILAEI
jgi:glycerol-3-phosphate dehydrogenase